MLLEKRNFIFLQPQFGEVAQLVTRPYRTVRSGGERRIHIRQLTDPSSGS